MNRSQFAVTRAGFTPEEIALICSTGDSNLEHASGDYTGVSRSSRVCMMSPSAQEGWLFTKLWSILEEHNKKFYAFDLDYIQPLQYSVYDSNANGHYEWHQDWGSAVFDPNRPELCRKLSFTLQLSDPADYEGGRLEINYGQDYARESEFYLEQGSLISFPSYMLHRISPVTRGTRKSLVGWCVGSDYR
jgi:PKHD-type hydroxylase